jgi:hypothetical protein
VRKRLYLLGFVDLGYDGNSRPVAVRLTKLGARLLGIATKCEERASVGNLIITPDYEVVLFPTGDDAELIHDLDRFCKREKNGHLVHFRILEKGVHRALSEGMYLRTILSTLEDNSRTPVPQNVKYSIRDWASHAGLLRINRAREVRSDNAEILERFRSDPGVRPYLTGEEGGALVKLKKRASVSRLQSLFRELGFLVEPDE